MDGEGKIFGVVFSFKGWETRLPLLEAAWAKLLAARGNANPKSHRRGTFFAATKGFSYGNGQTVRPSCVCCSNPLMDWWLVDRYGVHPAVCRRG